MQSPLAMASVTRLGPTELEQIWEANAVEKRGRRLCDATHHTRDEEKASRALTMRSLFKFPGRDRRGERVGERATSGKLEAWRAGGGPV